MAEETETFTYDFLDRLTSASAEEIYSESYSYDEIGNLTSKNGISYTYGTKPHAVTAVGATSYAYDDNGNMTDRENQYLTWDVENRLVEVDDGVNNTTFVYDGNGNRVKKTEGGKTILYVNKYYEENLTTEEVTTYYYHGGKLVAKYQGTDLSYIHQDHLTGTSVMTDSSGDELGTIKYFPFGATRSGSVPTDKKFTGQRLDETGLYYYGARYYDAEIGRFISADTIVPDPTNPQSFNRYSYCLNNPLKYTDPTGHVGGYEEAEGWSGYGTSYGEGVDGYQAPSGGSGSYPPSGSSDPGGSSPSLPADKGGGGNKSTNSNFPDELLAIESQLGDISIIELIHNGKVTQTFRFVWAEIDMSGPRWVLSESFTSAGGYYYNTQLMADQVYASEVIAIQRQCMADDLNVAADAIEFIGPGVSMIPPEFMITAGGLASIPGAALPVVIVMAVYAGVVYGPNILRGAANGIAPN